MKEKKNKLLELLQSKVKGYVRIETDYTFHGWVVTIKYGDFNFGVIIFEENIHKYSELELVRYVIEKYKDEINSYYFN